MQIALTKKLADGLKLKPQPAAEEIDPLFIWTANWKKTWDNRRAEDMLILVNHATRFVVAVYQVKRKDLKNIKSIIQTAISNTFAELNIHSDVIESYLKQAGEIEFTKNTNRNATAWLNQAGHDSAAYVVHHYNGIDKIFDDTIGTFASNSPVNFSKKISDGYYPNKKIIQSLSELTNLPIYNYKAFELLVTLDLGIYKATRRIIVPSNITFKKLHQVLQKTFSWKNYHLYEFEIFNKNQLAATLVAFEDSLDYNPGATLINNQTLADYLPEHEYILYRYDMGDNWEHEIELVRVIENHHENSPYLLEAEGQSPPEDVGGVPGFLYFREIMLDPKHPEHYEMNRWVGYWSLELSDYDKRPRLID